MYLVFRASYSVYKAVTESTIPITINEIGMRLPPNRIIWAYIYDLCTYLIA